MNSGASDRRNSRPVALPSIEEEGVVWIGRSSCTSNHPQLSISQKVLGATFLVVAPNRDKYEDSDDESSQKSETESFSSVSVHCKKDVRPDATVMHRSPSFRGITCDSLGETCTSETSEEPKAPTLLRDDSMQTTPSSTVCGDELVGIDIEQPSRPRTSYKDEDFTNEPHPALETPLLYFCLRRSPRMLSAILAFYNMRWDISYPLQNRIPCSRVLRKVKVILTWSELFLLLPFFVLLIGSTIYTFIEPSVAMSGHTARMPLIFAFVSAMKNNLLTFLLGMPAERAIKYHKLSARLAALNGLLHTYVSFRFPVYSGESNFFLFLFQDMINSGGTALILFMTGMIITSLPWVRRKFFEVFYYVHVVFAISMMACAFYHTGYLVPLLGSLNWGIDLAVRKVYMPFFRYPRRATLKVISDTVVEISFKKQEGFDFNPGQYVYIAVPDIGFFQWHPFSLSSSPKQKMVTLHIRKGGDWTGKLYQLAQRQEEIDILIEGPYGSVGVDFTNPYRYQTILLFSGGIGVTPMQSLCNSLMYEHSHDVRKLRKLSFVWIERDPVVMPEVDVVRRESIRHRDDQFDTTENTAEDDVENGMLGRPTLLRSVPNRSLGRQGLQRTLSNRSLPVQDIASELLALVPQSHMTDRQLAASYPSHDFGIDDSRHGGRAPHATYKVSLPDEKGVFHARGTLQPDEESTGAVVHPQMPDSPSNQSEETHRFEKPSLHKSRSVTFNVEESNPSWRAGDERSVDVSFLDKAFDQNAATDDAGPLDLQVYLTSKTVSRNNDMAKMPFCHLSRPDFKQIFRAARHDALQNHQARVAVCVCAPLRIVDLCRKACAKYSDRYVAFDFHYEVFE